MFNKVLTKDERLQMFSKLWEANYGDDPQKLVIKNENLMGYLNYGGFMTAPASTKYHGAYEGGLFDHSFMVTRRLIELTQNNGLKWEREESPFIVGMFHDLCKCDQYIKREQKPEKPLGTIPELGMEIPTFPDLSKPMYEYNEGTLLKGHGVKSIMILSQFLVLTEEEMLCIRFHMGAYEKDDWKEYDMAIRAYENVLWTHHADMLASKVDDI